MTSATPRSKHSVPAVRSGPGTRKTPNGAAQDVNLSDGKSKKRSSPAADKRA